MLEVKERYIRGGYVRKMLGGWFERNEEAVSLKRWRGMFERWRYV